MPLTGLLLSEQSGILLDMRLEGWNHLPRGYGADWDLTDAPRWLRWWFHTPFVDRFAYPVAVQRAYGWLTAAPGWAADDLGEVPEGWRIRPADYVAPGSISGLRRGQPRPLTDRFRRDL